MLENRILVVDDDSLMRDFLKETLERSGYSVDLASTGEEALESIQEKDYEIILSDIRMPSMSGMEVLRMTKEYLPDAEVIMMTAYGTVENAVEAMKLGAFDYVMKPFSADAIELKLKRAFERIRLKNENRNLHQVLEEAYQFGNIVGKTTQMQKIFESVKAVADSNATVLITGESGTGKELVAKAIHYNSSRKNGPFIKINCAALSEGVVESELFGHVKGAFTGAIRESRGRFELADRGTILLDEISEISPSVQAKLLRVLQEKEFEKLGSGETIQVDVRIISTSNKNLREQIKKGKFREDLFYRLNVIPLHIPPLRERKGDIPVLAEHFLKKYNHENNRSVEGISERVYEAFIEYPWPGNVRELENYIERAVVTSRGKILILSDLPREIAFRKEDFSSETIEVGCSIHEAEKKLILKTLEAEGGNRTKAAEILGISTRTLRNKLQEYGLKEEASDQ